MAYLLVRAFEADFDTLRDLVWRSRNATLLINTVVLTAAVLVVVTALALPVAWLTTRVNIAFRRAIIVLMVLPLAIPPYLMAYALRAAGGPSGSSAALLGMELPVLTGFRGALIALSLYNFPYMFLNLRAALGKADHTIEDAARSLGDSPVRVFFFVLLPQLRPALSAGALLVAMRVLGDFGVVSLMRYETFSYALYLQYEAPGGRAYAACLAIILLLMTGVLLYLDMRFVRNLQLHRTTGATARKRKRIDLGRWVIVGYALILLMLIVGFVAPIGTILFWFSRGWEAGLGSQLAKALGGSVGASLPAALVATFLAVPVAYLAQRFPSRWSVAIDRVAYLGYATPCLAFGLGVIFFSLMLMRVWPVMGFLYQSLFVLIYAYSLHFLAEALGPVRSCLTLATPRIEQASRSLGESPWMTFHRVTLPLLRPGLVGGACLVFLSAMKELPLTFLLSPTGYKTLSVSAWSYSNEAMFAQAAPFALLILIVSSGLVAALLYFGREHA